MSEAPKRRHFWIDRSLQLRVLAFVLLLLGAAMTVTYVSLDRAIEQTSEESRRLFLPVDWARESLRVPFVLTSSIVLVGGGLLTLLWSHRMIGPLLVLMAGLRRVREGNLAVDLKIRDTDSLGRAIDDFAAMQAALRKAVEEDRRRLAQADQRLGKLEERLHKDHGASREIETLREELRKVTEFFRLPSR